MNILKICLQVALFIVLGGIIFTAVTSRTSIYGIRSYTVASGSMMPILQIGSVIYIKPTTNYSVGNIITFNRNGTTITHRISALKNGQFQTKGDANKIADGGLVNPHAVYGKEFFDIPMLGLLTAFTRTTLGYILLIALPSFLFIGYEVWNIKEEYRKEIEKKLLHKQESL